MPTLKKEFAHKHRPPQTIYCSTCRTYSEHRQRIDLETGWTYFACDVCQWWVGEEIRKGDDKMTLKVGDPVEVIDSGLLMLRNLGAGTNHHGWVQELDYAGSGDILVEFPIGDDNPDEHSQVAPYPANCVIAREGKRRDELSS